MLIQASSLDVSGWKMRLGKGTFACTVQQSDRHKCPLFDWPDAENIIVLLPCILCSSKHLDLLVFGFFHTSSYLWLLSLVAGISSLFCFSVMFFWVMTEVKSHQHVFFLSSECFSLSVSSVPEVLCMAKKMKKIIEVKRILEMQRFLWVLIQIAVLLKKKSHQNLESILTSNHFCLSYMKENQFLFQISFYWNPHV